MMAGRNAIVKISKAVAYNGKGMMSSRFKAQTMQKVNKFNNRQIVLKKALIVMSIQMYFINETKKQVVDTKKLYGDFEDKQQLLCYLNLCQGDVFRTEFENSQWIEEWLYDGLYPDFKQINLYEFSICPTDDLYKSKEFDRLRDVVNAI